ncbi:unnamed protein product [marine sediment metagenome]|uniref:Uncharacterized protein n=1 Tax=marine sediment metagenome TaxID=412755 RepID=X1NSN0_9ZZZZ
MSGFDRPANDRPLRCGGRLNDGPCRDFDLRRRTGRNWTHIRWDRSGLAMKEILLPRKAQKNGRG